MPPELELLEERLRDAERELSEYKGQISRMADDISFIRQSLEKVSEASARIDHLDKLDEKINKAHKRIDDINEKFMKLNFEHESCMRTSSDETKALQQIKDDLKSLKDAVSKLTKDEEAVKGFWRGRLEKFVDTAIPVILTVTFTMVFLHFNGKGLTNDSEMDKEQMAAIEQLKHELQDMKNKQTPTELPKENRQ